MRLLGIDSGIGRFLARVFGQNQTESVSVFQRHALHDLEIRILGKPSHISELTSSGGPREEARFNQMVKEWTGKRGGNAKGRRPRHFKMSG